MSTIKADFLQALTYRVDEVTSPMMGLATLFDNPTETPETSLFVALHIRLVDAIGAMPFQRAMDAAYHLRNLFQVYTDTIKMPRDIQLLARKANDLRRAYRDIACDDSRDFSPAMAVVHTMTDLCDCYQILSAGERIASAIIAGYQLYFSTNPEGVSPAVRKGDWYDRLQYHLRYTGSRAQVSPPWSDFHVWDRPISSRIIEILCSFVRLYKSELQNAIDLYKKTGRQTG